MAFVTFVGIKLTFNYDKVKYDELMREVSYFVLAKFDAVLYFKSY